MNPARKRCTSCNLSVEKAKKCFPCPGGSTCVQGRSVQKARQLSTCRLCGKRDGHHDGCPILGGP